MKGAKSGAAALARASPAAHRSDFCFPAGSQAPSRGLASAPRSDSQHGDLSRSSHPLSPRLPVACHQKQTKNTEKGEYCVSSPSTRSVPLKNTRSSPACPKSARATSRGSLARPRPGVSSSRAGVGAPLLRGVEGTRLAVSGGAQATARAFRGVCSDAAPGLCCFLGPRSLGTPKSFGWIGKRGRRRVRAGKPCG